MDAILFTNSFSTASPIKRHFLIFSVRILSILFYVQYLHKIIKKMCFWGNEKAAPKLRAGFEQSEVGDSTSPAALRDEFYTFCAKTRAIF